jgi:SAM-dependent methyltransferase
MHPTIFAAFDRICRTRCQSWSWEGTGAEAGARVLEVGALATPDTLLRLPALQQAALRVGANREAFEQRNDIDLVQVGADSLACFGDGCFDAVLCNSVLEHDAAFWQTLAGIRRVARPGALIVIGVPGYVERLPPALLGWPVPGWIIRLVNRINPSIFASTPTLVPHYYPGDYYRFSPQAMREVLLAGCTHVEVEVLMHPPRIIGHGFRAGRPDGCASSGAP